MAGAALGLEAINGASLSLGTTPVILAIALFAATMLIFSKPKWVEKILIFMVLMMSAAFVLTFLLIRPDLGAMLRGFIPTIPDEGLMTAIALIGTTIVPYNLFLHAASAREHWNPEQLPEAQLDNRISIGIGGLVSMTILATAAASLFGSDATIVQGIFGASHTRAPFRIGALIVILFGASAALLGYRPVELIFVAQIANGLLLPIVAVFLLILANDKNLLGENANGLKSNILGIIILLVTTALGVRLIARALGFWP